jgi:hypothetical protein
MRRLFAAAALILGVAAAPAQARPPVLLDTHGEAVNVAVDAQGVAHLAYNATNYPAEQGEPLMYCAWPLATANRCTPRPIVIDGGDPAAQPPLIQTGPAPGQLTIVSSRQDIDVIRSPDGGADWTNPVSVGSGRWFGGAIGPNGQLALSFSNVGYIEFYERSLTGSPDDDAEADLNHGYYTESVTGFAGNIPVLVSGASLPHIAVSSWSGQGDIHDPATWIGPFKMDDSNYYDLAGGPRGLWLAFQTPTHTGDDRIYARRFNAKTRRFGPRHAIRFGRLGFDSIINLGLGQGPDGRMLVAWYDTDHDRIDVSASRTGAHWTKAEVAATGVTLPSQIHVGLGPKGRGLVVWDDNGDEKIKAVKVDAATLLKRG